MQKHELHNPNDLTKEDRSSISEKFCKIYGRNKLQRGYVSRLPSQFSIPQLQTNNKSVASELHPLPLSYSALPTVQV